ncbi:hypothetical protein ACER0A_013635 [Haloimpatiens sp. FM7315]|uniref:hypothetical protein n=1 Tax=Haloimpatiens sp. FM7315 TaxID=3298609 RepID=UPI0035A35BF3
MDNFNINISKEARKNLINLLKKNPSYSCIRIDYTPSCKGGGFDLFLDEFKENYIIESIDNLYFMYSDFLLSKALSLDILFKNETFMIKAVPKNKTQISSKNCSNNCGSCDNCSSCLSKANCHKNKKAN